MLLALPVAAVANVLLRYAQERYTAQPAVRRRAYRRSCRRRAADGRIRSRTASGSAAGETARTDRHALPAARPQLPLALRYPPDQRLETFVGAPGGRAGAVARAGATATGARLAVPAGAPRHRQDASAAGDLRGGRGRGRRAAYLPLARRAGRLRDALDALEATTWSRWTDSMRSPASATTKSRCSTSTTARALPASPCSTPRAPARTRWPLVLPDLRSRLAQCSADRVAAAGRRRPPRSAAPARPASRTGVRRRGAGLAAAAASERDLAALTALLDRLDRASLAAQRRITVPFLRQVLGAGALTSG